MALATRLRHREQHGRVLGGLQAVRGVRDDQQVAFPALPGIGAADQADPSVQDVNGGLAGIVVLGERLPGGQRYDGLAEYVLVTAVDGARGAACG